MANLLTAEFKNYRLFKAIVITVCLILIFFFGFKTMGDPDIGWHLRAGEEIVERGEVPAVDWFTHSYRDFGWIDHEWLTNVALFELYELGGPFLLSAIFGALVIFLFAYLLPRTVNSPPPFYQSLIFGALGAGVITFYVGVRPQLLTLLGVVLLLVIFQKLRLNPSSRAIYWLPVLFLVWANLHASFPVGLGIFFVLLVTEMMKRRVLERRGSFWFADPQNTLTWPAIRKLGWILPLSLAVTLVNPYGWRIYIEVSRTLFDNYGTREIQEWLAPDITQPYGLAFGIYLALLLGVFFFRRAKMDLSQFVLFLLFLLASLLSLRHIPLFVVVTLPWLMSDTRQFFDQFFIPILKNKAVLIGLAAVAILGVFSGGQMIQNVKRSFNDREIFAAADIPVSAVRELKNLALTGNMLNEYNWGGYLIWQAPEYPVFIDGRTAHWKKAGTGLLQEFLDTVNYRVGTADILEKYDISFIFVRPDRPLIQALRGDPAWEMIYSDDKAVIMKKVTSNK